MKSDKLHTKNKRTGKHESIIQRNIERTDYCFYFFVNSEIEAFKAAYIYRHSPHGVVVEFAKGAGEWMVTVFNAAAAEMGIDGAK